LFTSCLFRAQVERINIAIAVDDDGEGIVLRVKAGKGESADVQRGQGTLRIYRYHVVTQRDFLRASVSWGEGTEARKV